MNERLDQIRQYYKDAHAKGMPYWTYDDDTQAVGYLLEQLHAAQAAVEGLREAHREEVLGILRDMRLPILAVPEPYGPGGDLNYGYDYVKGRNLERHEINQYCEQKAYEYSPAGLGPTPTQAGQWDTTPTPQPQKGGEGA